ncbi:hypothetical protein B0H19DRAFT_1084288 [Mycena capillaripes]|nr:hypothetical protein B0H19DRAFT_1084288 [Mycena capillaripes]
MDSSFPVHPWAVTIVEETEQANSMVNCHGSHLHLSLASLPNKTHILGLGQADSKVLARRSILGKMGKKMCKTQSEDPPDLIHTGKSCVSPEARWGWTSRRVLASLGYGAIGIVYGVRTNVNRKAAGRKRQRPSRMIDGGKMIIRIRVIPSGQIRSRGAAEGSRYGYRVGGSQEEMEKEEWGVDEGRYRTHYLKWRKCGALVNRDSVILFVSHAPANPTADPADMVSAPCTAMGTDLKARAEIHWLQRAFCTTTVGG